MFKGALTERVIQKCPQMSYERFVTQFTGVQFDPNSK